MDGDVIELRCPACHDWFRSMRRGHAGHVQISDTCPYCKQKIMVPGSTVQYRLPHAEPGQEPKVKPIKPPSQKKTNSGSTRWQNPTPRGSTHDTKEGYGNPANWRDIMDRKRGGRSSDKRRRTI